MSQSKDAQPIHFEAKVSCITYELAGAVQLAEAVDKASLQARHNLGTPVVLAVSCSRKGCGRTSTTNFIL